MSETRIVIRTGGLGDLVLFYPVMKALHARHGEALSLITSSGLIEEVFRHCEFVGEVHLLRARRVPRWFNASLRAINRFADGPIECLYNLDGSVPRADFFARLENAAKEVVSAAALPLRGEFEHDADCGLRMISADANVPRVSGGEFAATVDPVIPVTEGELRECGKWLDLLECRSGKRILLQAGNKCTMKKGAAKGGQNEKDWSVSKWVAVIDALLDDVDCSVLLCGAPSEWEWLESIRVDCGESGRVWNVSRDLPIRRFMSLARLVGSCYLGVDTGPAHVAAAMGCPSCILYGPSRSVHFLPLSWGQLIIPLEKVDDSKPEGARPEIGLITVDEVTLAMERLLREGAHPESLEFSESTLIAG